MNSTNYMNANTKNSTPSHTVIKLTKSKDKEGILKASREKWFMDKGSSKTMEDRRHGRDILKMLKKVTINQEFCIWQNMIQK